MSAGNALAVKTKTSILARFAAPDGFKVRAENDNIDFGSMSMQHATEASEQMIADAEAYVLHTEELPRHDDGTPVGDLSELYPSEVFDALSQRAHRDTRFAARLFAAMRDGLVPSGPAAWSRSALPQSISVARLTRRVLLRSVDRHLMTRVPHFGYRFEVGNFAGGLDPRDRTPVRDLLERPAARGHVHIAMPDGDETATMESNSPSWAEIVRAMPPGDGSGGVTGLKHLPTEGQATWLAVSIRGGTAAC